MAVCGRSEGSELAGGTVVAKQADESGGNECIEYRRAGWKRMSVLMMADSGMILKLDLMKK
jgi:hypothetical protein